MPAALRRRMRALRASVALAGSPNASGGAYPAPLNADVLAVLALACRDGERVRLRYMHTAGPDAGKDSARLVEPVALVPRGTRWYLVCRDLERGWRALRLDRITRAGATGLRFEGQPPPGGDPAAFLARELGAPPRRFSATILIHAPIEQVQAYMGGYAADFSATTTSAGGDATHWRVADVRLEVLAGGLLWLRWPFEVLDSPELTALLRDRAQAFTAAASHPEAAPELVQP